MRRNHDFDHNHDRDRDNDYGLVGFWIFVATLVATTFLALTLKP
jgi:hypothetical protein